MTRVISRLFILAGVVFLFSGCAATQIALEKKDLKVETKMSQTIFLDIDNENAKTIYVDIRNTSDKDVEIKETLLGALKDKGYTIATKPSEAFYLLQGNVLYVGQANPSAMRESLYAGYGGAMAGGVTGAVIGATSNRGLGGFVGFGLGSVIGGAAEMVSGALVKDVTFSIMTDLLVSGKTAKGQRQQYKTRILSTANQVNLKYEEAQSPLTANLARSIAGIF